MRYDIRQEQMARRRTVTYAGQSVEGEDVGYEIVRDGALVLQLDDGARIRVKPIVLNVLKTEQFVNGDRLYIVQHVVHVMSEEIAEADRGQVTAALTGEER